MAKDKKKKHDAKKDKPSKKGKSGGKSRLVKAAKKLKAASENPLVADIVAAALVATAAALKDSKKAHLLAAEAGDEIDELASAGAKSGSAMWQLALDIAHRTLEEVAEGGRARKP